MKSPKEVFAETVAYELSDYLVVDPKLVKAKLLEHSKIVLRNVLLKTQTLPLDSSSASSSSSSNAEAAVITGVIDLVIFEWSWTVRAGWVKDCVLKILGLRVHVKLGKVGAVSPLATNPEKYNSLDLYMDRQIQNVIDSLTLHVKTYQVTLDMPLNLQDSSNGDMISIVFAGSAIDIACCDGTSVADSAIQENDGAAAATITTDTSSIIDQQFSMSSLSAHVLVKSNSSHQEKPLSYPLMEPFSYNAHVKRLGGLRFESLTTGLVVFASASAAGDGVDEHDATSAAAAETGNNGGGSSKSGNGKIVIHAGAVQMQALSQLANIMNGGSTDGSSSTRAHPPSNNDAAEDESESGIDKNTKMEGIVKAAGSSSNSEARSSANRPTTESKHGTDAAVKLSEDSTREALSSATDESATETTEVAVDTQDTPEYIPSSFDIPIASFSVVFMEKMLLTIAGLHVKYKSDGTLLTLQARRFDVESNALDDKKPGLQAGVAGIECSVLPSMKLTIDTIERAHVPGVLDLTKELKFPSIEFEGDTAYVDVASTMEATILNEDVREEENEDADALESAKSDVASHKQKGEGNGGVVPFPVRVCFQDLKLTEESDKSLTHMSNFVVAFHPQNSAESSGTAVATHLGEFKNDLLHCQNANASVIVSEKSPRIMRGFSLDADSIHVQSGYTMEDWIEQFEPSRLRQLLQAKEGPLHLPFAHIAALSIQIGFQGSGISVNDTTVNVKAFHGKAKTTTKDVVNYYAKACARRVSGFISNAQIEGHNLVETTAVYGTVCAGLEDLGGPSAVVALAGVDSAKALLARGKASRHVKPDDNYKPGDFIRGILATPGHFANRGAKVRGKDDAQHEDVTDMAVGAVSSVGDYTVDNKARLGGAFFAGIGVLGGAAIAGPLGAILGGIIAGAVATKALKRFDDSAIGRKANQRIKDDLAGQRLPRLAAKHYASEQNDPSKAKEHDGHRPGLLRHHGHREKHHHDRRHQED